MNILTALSTYSNIVSHVHSPTLKASAILCTQIFHVCEHVHVLSRNFRKNRNSGGLTDIVHCNLWASKYYIAHLANFTALIITANNDKQ